MKKIHWIELIINLFIIINMFIFFAAAETEEEKAERMLAQFDQPSITPGKLIVSFSETTNKAQAIIILKNAGATLQQVTVCMSEVNPGEMPKELGCKAVDAWDDSLKTATAIVPQGQEKVLAEKLYDREKVVWVEPSYTASAGDDGISPEEEKLVEPLQESEEDEQPLEDVKPIATESINVFERFWNWLASLFS